MLSRDHERRSSTFVVLMLQASSNRGMLIFNVLTLTWKCSNTADFVVTFSRDLVSKPRGKKKKRKKKTYGGRGSRQFRPRINGLLTLTKRLGQTYLIGLQLFHKWRS